MHPSFFFQGCAQRLWPQRFLTRFFKIAANWKYTPFKNWMINHFVKTYHVNFQEAILTRAEDYPTFNAFFVRYLKPELRVVASGDSVIISPVDGCVREIGCVAHGQFIQAKGHNFSVLALLGGNLARSEPFLQGSYMNLYLAPKDYHRVHMPCDGVLKTMVYIPGKLFPVKASTVAAIPTLFAQNERAALFFETPSGPMVMVLVGALIVGNLHVKWHGDIKREKNVREWDYSQKPLVFKKGDEVGYFNLGSTVITIFGPQKIQWKESLDSLKFGQEVGEIL